VPELPDVTLYVEALGARVLGRRLLDVRLRSPFLLRTAVPALAAVRGRSVIALRRLGKRVVVALGASPRASEPERLFLALHLMIAGRLHWKAPGAVPSRRTDLAAFDFEGGTLLLTEAGTKRRAALHVFADEAGLSTLDRGGLEPLACTPGSFAERLRSSPHTLKRALCDPRLVSGIGNAYSDEILHRARFSPLQRVSNLSEDQLAHLLECTRTVLQEWIERLRQEAGLEFPTKVTAFRPGMAVHGRFGQPCPTCGAPIQRIVRAENEVNYCPRCQTGGKILKDRALSLLLKDDWPGSLEELGEG
jgi:formamidopyrimidine-DNA glycosylase